MYALFTILLFLVSISIITLIILSPNKHNIINSLNSNKEQISVTPQFLQNSLNITILVLIFCFYSITIILNWMNNHYLNEWSTNLKNNKNNTMILPK